MNDRPRPKRNRRSVWIWSAAISAVIAASLTFAIFADEPSYTAPDRWTSYIVVGVVFWAMMTVMGAGAMLHISYEPVEESRREPPGEEQRDRS